MIRVSTAFAVCAGLVMMGCGTAEYDWNKALAANTLAAYQSFLKHHGTSKYADDARGRMLGLRDDQAWSLAQATHTIDGYQSYLQTESGGVHASDAQYQITALERARAWKAVQKDSVASLQAFLRKYPQGSESNDARRRLATLDFHPQRTGGPARVLPERPGNQPS
jgi:outer membrane protein assembly factor BamD (BamD/ComL family)